MENEQEKDTPNQEDLEAEIEETTEEQPEEKPEKKEFSDEDKLARAERIAEKLRKKLGKDDSTKKEEKAPKSNDLDYGAKAFLVANGIKGAKETALVEEYIAQTGKTLDDILENKHFKNDLADLRESTASENALPKGNRRSGSPAKDDVSVALAKFKQSGELPESFDLREKVVDAMLKQDKSNAQFYNS